MATSSKRRPKPGPPYKPQKGNPDEGKSPGVLVKPGPAVGGIVGEIPKGYPMPPWTGPYPPGTIGNREIATPGSKHKLIHKSRGKSPAARKPSSYKSL
jgi:hypothetical protein